MKKVFSIVAAMMVALFAMVSCGAVKSAQDGMAAGEAYGKAFTAANGDLQAIVNAYNEVGKAATPYLQDQIQISTFIVAVVQTAEGVSADCAGSYLAIAKKTSMDQGVDQSALIQAYIDSCKDKAAVTAAMDKFFAAITTPAPAQEEVPAADEEAAADGEASEEAAE